MNNLKQKVRNSIPSDPLNSFYTQESDELWTRSNQLPYNEYNSQSQLSFQLPNKNDYLKYSNIIAIGEEDDKPLDFPPPPPLPNVVHRRSPSLPPFAELKSNKIKFLPKKNQPTQQNSLYITDPKISKSSTRIFDELDERVSKSRKALSIFNKTEKLDNSLLSQNLLSVNKLTNNNTKSLVEKTPVNNTTQQYQNNSTLSFNSQHNRIKNNIDNNNLRNKVELHYASSPNIWTKRRESFNNDNYDNKYYLPNNYDDSFVTENNNFFNIKQQHENNQQDGLNFSISMITKMPKQKNSYGRPSESEDSALPGI